MIIAMFEKDGLKHYLVLSTWPPAYHRRCAMQSHWSLHDVDFSVIAHKVDHDSMIFENKVPRNGWIGRSGAESMKLKSQGTSKLRLTGEMENLGWIAFYMSSRLLTTWGLFLVFVRMATQNCSPRTTESWWWRKKLGLITNCTNSMYVLEFKIFNEN